MTLISCPLFLPLCFPFLFGFLVPFLIVSSVVFPVYLRNDLTMFFRLFHLCLLNLSIFPLPIVPCLPFTLFSPPLNLFSPAPRKIRRARLPLRIIRLDLSWPLLAVPRSRLQDLHDAPQSPSRISDSRGHSALSASVLAADLSPPRLLSNTYSPDSATSRGK